MSKVDFKKKVVKSLTPLWNQIKDVLTPGAVRAAGDTYLPRPNPTDESEENKARYDQLLQRAVFFDITARTLRGMCGQVFSRPSILELPEQLAILENDVDGGGTTIKQLSKKCVSIALSTGHGGLLVDHPTMEVETSLQDIQDKRLLPKILFFEEEEIINWDTAVIDGHQRLTLLVIEQNVTRRKNTFEEEEVPQYLVLRLLRPEDLGLTKDGEESANSVDIDEEVAAGPDARPGVYLLEVWKRAKDSENDTGESDEFVRDFSVIPLRADGTPFPAIPFQPFGWEDNGIEPNDPPLSGMAELNIAHWRNSADYQESTHIAGQATPVLTGLTETWVKEILKGKIHLGSRAAIFLPEGGEAVLLQAAANSAPKESMDMLKADAIAIGARLMDPSSPLAQSATAAAIDAAEEVSVLTSAVENVTEALNQCLAWCAEFVGVDVPEDMDTRKKSGPYIELNKDFAVNNMSPEERRQLLAEWQSEAITTTELRRNLERGGVAFQDKEEYEGELAATGPRSPDSAFNDPNNPDPNNPDPNNPDPNNPDPNA
jgi:Domain of unknown function (DUF4055)